MREIWEDEDECKEEEVLRTFGRGNCNCSRIKNGNVGGLLGGHGLQHLGQSTPYITDYWRDERWNLSGVKIPGLMKRDRNAGQGRADKKRARFRLCRERTLLDFPEIYIRYIIFWISGNTE